MRHLLLIVMLILCPAMRADDDLGREANAVMKPLVRVKFQSGYTTVTGTGTLIYSEDRENVGEHKTFILTNHHVVREAIHVVKKWDSLTQTWKYSEQNDQVTVEVFNYLRGGRTVLGQPIKADIVAHNEDEDLALLQLDYPAKLDNVAQLLPSDRQLNLLEPAIAVGCSLGVDPIVTRGEIVDLEYMIQHKPYIMATADIIFGNSGGAVFTLIDGEYYFIGVPTRAVTAGISGLVTHMGFFIPIERIRKFIALQKLDFLIDESKTPTECFEAREKLQRKGNKAQPPPPGAEEDKQGTEVEAF